MFIEVEVAAQSDGVAVVTPPWQRLWWWLV
jgi:hypothetical protein